MFDKMKASSKLYLLVFIMTVFIIGIGAYGISELSGMKGSTKTIYHDRVFPLQQLTSVRFSYSDGILSSAQKVHDQQISFSEAKKEISQAQEIIAANWDAYMLTYLTPEEERLAKETGVLMRQSNKTIEKLKSILSREDVPALDSMIRFELYPVINPIIVKSNELVNLQVKVGGEVYQKSNENYNKALQKFVLIIFLSLIIAIPFSYYLVRGVKKLIEDLRESNFRIKEGEEKYRYLFENSPAYILIWDLESLGVVEVNNAVVEKYGYSREEWTNMRVLDYRPIEDHEKIKEFAQRMLSGEEPLARMVWTHLKKNGEEMLMEIASHKITYNGRKAILSLARDITEQTKAEAALRKSEEVFRSLIDHAGDAIFMIMDDGIIFDVNQSASELLKYTREEMVGRSVLDFYPKEEHAQSIKGWDTLRKNKSFTNERKLLRKDNTQVEVEISRTMLPDASGAIAIVRDITERKQAEEHRDQLLTDLTHRYNELMQFNYIVSHNLRAPLANIIGLTNIIEVDKKAEGQEKTINYIKDTAKRMDEVIHDLTKILALQTTINEKKEIIDLSKIIHAITETLSRQINTSAIDIHVSIESDANNFSSIKAYFESILFNLISNSIKYQSRNRKPKLIIKAVKRQDEIILKVEDNGIGINLDLHRNKIFGLYARFNTETEGKGLGLYMAKAQVESLGGKIEVESIPDKGSTFTIRLKIN